MWCGCQLVIDGFSDHTGTSSSTAASTKNDTMPSDSGSARRSSQATCTAETPNT